MIKSAGSDVSWDEGAHNEDIRVRAASLILKLRAAGISDHKVLRAMELVPRQLFVPEELVEFAFEDRALPIDCGQTISAPSVVALMTAKLDLDDRHTVLEIGTGTGYQSAVLARIARRVTTIDRYRTLVKQAEERWQALKIPNISAIIGDGMQGWPQQAPFDRIMITAACEKAPSKLISQLVDGGKLIAPIGHADEVQRLTLFIKDGETVETHDITAVRFVPMVAGIAQKY